MWGSDRAGGKRLSVAAVVAVLGVAVAWVQPAAGQTTQPPAPKCENFSCQDPLFTVDYPAKDTFVTSHGVEVHAPAQFYNSKAFLVFGSGDLRFASKLAAGTGYQPVQTDDGHAIVDLDLNEWDDTNLGPYHEMILIVPVNRGKVVV